MGSERCSLLHRHPAAGVGGLEMAVGFQNSKFLSVHFFSIYHTGVYPKYHSSRQVECTTARPNKLQGGFWASDSP